MADLCAHVLYVCAVQLLKAQRSRYPDVVLPLCKDLVAVTRDPGTMQKITQQKITRTL